MNISLALGLHFDSGAKNNPVAQLAEQGHIRHAEPTSDTIIDIVPEPEARNYPGFGHGRKILLTYNMHGLAEPVWADISMLNIYV